MIFFYPFFFSFFIFLLSAPLFATSLSRKVNTLLGLHVVDNEASLSITFITIFLARNLSTRTPNVMLLLPEAFSHSPVVLFHLNELCSVLKMVNSYVIPQLSLRYFYFTLCSTLQPGCVQKFKHSSTWILSSRLSQCSSIYSHLGLLHRDLHPFAANTPQDCNSHSRLRSTMENNHPRQLN